MSDSTLRDLAAKAPEALRRHIAYRVRKWTHPDELEAPDEPTAEDDAVLAKLVGEVPGLLDRLDALEAENARLRRVLAVERGDECPDGWSLTRVEDGRRCWSRSDEGAPEFAVCTEAEGFWTWSTGADTMWEIDKGSADTALEAMEAADVALEGDDG